ncbi:MAG: hypothetical protein FJ056_03970 [Cyanobacteria bacterium M_surface_10_m2_179]|nr:hypothetical protein [Cyanobacteria bacterium M_surface_10_m2_179]
MADGDFQPSSNPRGGRGPRDGAGREPGGFRIRLSDNEMRAARAVQEVFGLRSTVAALGLSIRTVAQLLEEGKLDEAVAQHKASGGGRPGGERRGPRPERGERPANNRPNPFARPARPAAAAAPEAVEPADDAAAPAEASTEASIDTEASEG